VASIQKTATRDLSTAIAGKIWEAIKDADTRKKLENSKASEDVKQAAVKLKKDDPNSIPVQDRDLKDTVVKIFGPLEGKLLQTEGKVENLSSKITTVAGSISDTQKLIINQNQILEDKFDSILNLLGPKSAIQKQKEAESKFEQLELDMERGLDLSGTFGTEKTSTGALGIYGKLFSSLLGGHFRARIVNQLRKSLIPVGFRSKVRLLSKPVKSFAKRIARKSSSFSSSVIKNLVKGRLSNTVGNRLVSPLFRSIGTAVLANRKFAKLASKAVNARQAKIADKIIRKELSSITAGGAAKIGTRSRSVMRGFSGEGFEMLRRAIDSGNAEQAIASVRLDKLNQKMMAEGGFTKTMSDPKVQAMLLEKLGPEGLEKITKKASAGALKSAIPLAGSVYGLVESLVRLSPAFGGSDWKGAALSMGSGLPVAGWGFTAIDIMRDIDRDAYERNIEGKYPPTDQDLAKFFSEALGIGPSQYEMGNVNIKAPTGGMGASISSISEILGVTKAFGDAAGFGPEVQGAINEVGLGSYPIPSANYPFDIGKADSISTVKGKKAKKETEELRMKKRKEEKKEDLEEKPDDKKDENKTNFMGADQSREGYKNQKWDFWDWTPDDWFNKKGGGGIGGDPVKAMSPIMGGSGSTIEFWGQQGRDLSGEPGVDFSYRDYKSNYNLFPGYVLETGLLYGSRYGNVVVVRSVDPSNGLEFDSLYSHFPDGGIAVKPGQVVSAEQYLGKVGFVSVDVPGVPQMQPNNAGNMSGWHTSVDFFEPSSSARYRNLNTIQSLVTGADGQTPGGLLEKLKPKTTNNNQSSLNSIEANSKLASTMTGMVENGSSERMMTKRKSSNRSPIVIVNNQIIKNNTTPIIMGNSIQEGNFFEAYNLARHTV